MSSTTLIFPGKEPTTFYLCIGKMPKLLVSIKTKTNISFNFLLLISIICHAYIHIHLFIQKYKENKQSRQAETQQDNRNQQTQQIQAEKSEGSAMCRTGIQNMVLNRKKQGNLFSLTLNAINLTILILSRIAPNIMNQTDPSIMDVYPNYMCFYIHQHMSANFGIL
jgi:uncharacterized protein (UPF0333 family)